MLKLFHKIVSVKNQVLRLDSYTCDQDAIVSVGKRIQEKAGRLFRGSLAIRQVDAGSDNACEQELVALSNPFYDIERFGIHFVASPKHADMLLVTGPVTRNMAEALRRAYDCVPNPKIVVAVGDDALDGGLFKGGYAVLDGVGNVIPTHFHIPGDPPSPKQILCGLLWILEAIEKPLKQ